MNISVRQNRAVSRLRVYVYTHNGRELRLYENGSGFYVVLEGKTLAPLTPSMPLLTAQLKAFEVLGVCLP